MMLLPFLIRHAVDALARGGLAQVEPNILGRLAVPTGQTVAAEARELHQVDVLNVASLPQVVHEAPECGGLDLVHPPAKRRVGSVFVHGTEGYFPLPVRHDLPEAGSRCCPRRSGLHGP